MSYKDTAVYQNRGALAKGFVGFLVVAVVLVLILWAAGVFSKKSGGSSGKDLGPIYPIKNLKQTGCCPDKMQDGMTGCDDQCKDIHKDAPYYQPSQGSCVSDICARPPGVQTPEYKKRCPPAK